MRGCVWLVRPERVENNRVPRRAVAGQEVHGTTLRPAHPNWRQGFVAA
jgi:hypothetical protein